MKINYFSLVLHDNSELQIYTGDNIKTKCKNLTCFKNDDTFS